MKKINPIEEFRKISYAIPVATVLLDEKSRILDVNPAFENLFGYKKREIIGKDLNELLVPKEEREDGYNLDKIAKDTGYLKVERERLSKDGKRIPVLVSGSSYKLGNGRIGVIGTYEDIRDIKKMQDAFYYQATHDLLTGLPNRYLLQDRFDVEKGRADRFHSKVVLFFIDINRFKDINDTYGHNIGDKVIQYVANTLRLSVRQTDTVVRFGGDEFVILFDEVKKKEDVVNIALNVTNAFSTPFKHEDLVIDVGLNIGITFYPDDGNTLEELLRKGDLAMFNAKATGVNNFVFYSQKMEEARLKTISDLKAREIMFKLVFNKSPLPQIIVDDTLKLLRVNEKFKSVFKIDLKALYGKSLNEIEGFREIGKYIDDLNEDAPKRIVLKIEDKDYNFNCYISKIKSLGKVYYLILFEEA